MSLKRNVADAVLGLGLGRLSGGRLHRGSRAVLDELDIQRVRDLFEGRRIDPTLSAQGDNDHDRARYNLHEFVTQYVKNEPIDYLEFGVYKGWVIRFWSEMNANPASRFVGFDSFEGLPSDWKGGEWGSKGSFTTGGEHPHICDDRVSFQKGWFSETVPAFMRDFVPKHRLVVHMDADMYLSTILPLIHIGPLLKPGSLLIFDEFAHRGDEFKAWQDFRKTFPDLNFRGVAQANRFTQVCYEVV